MIPLPYKAGLNKITSPMIRNKTGALRKSIKISISEIDTYTAKSIHLWYQYFSLICLGWISFPPSRFKKHQKMYGRFVELSQFRFLKYSDFSWMNHSNPRFLWIYLYVFFWQQTEKTWTCQDHLSFWVGFEKNNWQNFRQRTFWTIFFPNQQRFLNSPGNSSPTRHGNVSLERPSSPSASGWSGSSEPDPYQRADTYQWGGSIFSCLGRKNPNPTSKNRCFPRKPLGFV